MPRRPFGPAAVKPSNRPATGNNGPVTDQQPSIVDWRDSPELPRKDQGWGLYFSRRRYPIAGLAIHHFAGEQDTQAINLIHQRRNFGEPGRVVYFPPHITYHIAIENDGRIILANYFWERCWHANLANDAFVGVVLQGDLDLRPPTQEQLRSLQWLLQNIAAMEGFEGEVEMIKGHGELVEYGNQTACPGRYLLDAKPW